MQLSPRQPDAAGAPARPELPFQGVAPGDDAFITVTGMDSVAVAFINESVVREHQAAIIERRLTALAQRAHGHVAVGLGDVEEMGSSGLSALVAAHSACKSLGGHLAVFGVGREVEKLLRVTKLDRTLAVKNSIDDAVRSFKKEEPRRTFMDMARGLFKRRDAA